MSKEAANYWIKEAKNVYVHHFHQDEEITVKQICDRYKGDTQIHMFVASKRQGHKNNLKGIPR